MDRDDSGDGSHVVSKSAMPKGQSRGTEVAGLAYCLMASVVPSRNAALLSLMVAMKTSVSDGQQDAM